MVAMGATRKVRLHVRDMSLNDVMITGALALFW